MLRTIVTESLAGRGEALKEIVLAREVFGRPDYDPRRHTLVRVEINAVRRKLAEYYVQVGRDDHVRIEIPPGHYVAAFSPVREEARRGGEKTRRYVIGGCGAALLAALVLMLVRRQSHPATTFVPVQITFDTGATAQPAVSRDGSVMVYASDRGPRGNAEIWIQQARKPPRQLTDDPAHNITPDVSPDGTRVAFRSWRKEEGIWWLPLGGGEPKLLAKGGYLPRFSPDGKRIAFTAHSASAGHVFAISAHGGVPEQLDYGMDEASCPVWSPDGSRVVFVGQAAAHGKYDLWTAATQDSRKEFARALDVQSKLRAQNLPAITAFNDCPQDWVDDRLLFETHEHDTSFVFETRLGPDGQLGNIHPLPFALGASGVRFLRSGDRLSVLFAPERRQTNIWAYNATDSDRLEQLTRDNTLIPGTYGTWPAMSGDGGVVAFITHRAGSPDICLRQILTGAEQLLGASPSPRSPLILNHNGSEIIFEREHGSMVSVVLYDIKKRTDHIVTTNCPSLQDWSKDGTLLLCRDGSDLFEMRLGESGKTVILHPPREPEFAQFSPDARWVAYVSTAGEGENVVGYLAPLDGSNRTIQMDQEVYTLSLRWSTDGNAIYFWSLRDGFRCLYLQRLDPGTKIPKGAPVAILHRHGSQRYPWSGGTLAVSSGRIAFTLTDELANIWKAELPR